MKNLETNSVSPRQITNLITDELAVWDGIDKLSLPKDWWECFEDFCNNFNYRLGGEDVYPYYGRQITGQKLTNIKEKFKEFLIENERQDILKPYEEIEFGVCLSVQKLTFKPYIQELTIWLKNLEPGESWYLGEILDENISLFRSFNSLYVVMSRRFPEKKLNHQSLMNWILSDKVLIRNPYEECTRGQHRYSSC